MSKTPAISIIIPAYENPDELDRCLNSLQNSELRDRSEVVVIDDFSRVHGRAIKEICHKYSAALYCQQENGGPGLARNRGAKEAKGDILVFIDSDCVAPQGWLSRLLAPIVSDKYVSACSCYSGPVEPSWITTFQDEDYRYRMPLNECEISFVNSCNFAINKTVFTELGGFPGQRISEDMVFGIMLAEKGTPTLFLPDAGVLHGYYDTVNGYLRQRAAFAFNTVRSLLERGTSAAGKSAGVRSYNPLRTAAGMLFVSIAVISFLLSGSALFYTSESAAFFFYSGLVGLLLETAVHGRFLGFLIKRQGLPRAASYIVLLYLIDLSYVAAVFKALIKAKGKGSI